MAFTFCTSGQAVFRAGAHMNSDLNSEVAHLSGLSEQAEGKIEAETGKDFTTNYASLPTGIKGELARVSSALIGMDLVAYDPTGYLTREADMIMNNLDGAYKEGLRVLKEFTKLNLKDPTR